MDLRDLLPKVRVPTLVVHYRGPGEEGEEQEVATILHFVT
jgi:hypothetical protein